MAEGEFGLIREHLELALTTSAEWVGEHDLYAMLADAAVRQRNQDALQQYAPLAAETADRYGHTLYQAIAQRAWGVLHRLAGDHSEAESRLRHALEIFAGLETHWQIGRSYAELAELARARNDSSAARDYYALALTEFEELDAIPDAARTRTALEAID